MTRTVVMWLVQVVVVATTANVVSALRSGIPSVSPFSPFVPSHGGLGVEADSLRRSPKEEGNPVVGVVGRDALDVDVDGLSARTRFPGRHKWLGGAVDVDVDVDVGGTDGGNVIYGIPAHAHSVLRIRCFSSSETDRSPEVDLLPLPLALRKRRFKWLRGIVTNDGALYGIPSWSTAGVLRMDLRRRPPRQRNGNGNVNGNDETTPLHGFPVEALPLPSSVLPNHKNDNKDDGKTESDHVNRSRWMWHGAAVAGDGHTLYAIPSNASRVLRIRGTEVTAIGPDLRPNGGSLYASQPKGVSVSVSVSPQNQWYGGIRGADGAVYGIPYAAGAILRVSHDDDVVSLHGDFGTDRYNWHGGIFCETNGMIYAFPSHAQTVLRIDTNLHAPPLTTPLTTPSTQTTDSLNAASTLPYRELPIHHRFQGNNNKIDNNNNNNNNNGVFSLNGKYKWLGGATGADGCIYGMPSDADCVLRINPFTDECTTLALFPNNDGNDDDNNDDNDNGFHERYLLRTQKNKWQGAVLAPKDGCLYAVPSDANAVLRIDTNPVSTATTTTSDKNNTDTTDTDSWNVSNRISFLPLPATVLACHEATTDRWQGGFLGADGNIYGIPENAERILRIVVDGNGGQPRLELL